MRLIFCIDKSGGMLLFGKRQSKDGNLRRYILNEIADTKLYMNRYSYGQFEEDDGGKIVVDDDYASKAGADDYCFVENGAYDPADADRIILCKWNRKYPGDVFFAADLKKLGFKKISVADVKGSSHEKITVETYERKAAAKRGGEA